MVMYSHHLKSLGYPFMGRSPGRYLLHRPPPRSRRGGRRPGRGGWQSWQPRSPVTVLFSNPHRDHDQPVAEVTAATVVDRPCVVSKPAIELLAYRAEAGLSFFFSHLFLSHDSTYSHP